MSIGSTQPVGDNVNDFATVVDVPVNPASDRIMPRQVASGNSRGVQQLGSPQVYADAGSSQIIVEDSTTPRVLMGDHQSFGEGFYVSKNGFNARLETNPSNYIFNSNQNVFKILSSGTTTIPVLTITAPTRSATVNAVVPFIPTLSFTPALLVYYFDTATAAYKPLPGDSANHVIQSSAAGGVLTQIVFDSFTFYSQPTGLLLYHDVFVAADTPSYSATLPAVLIKYFVLQESLSS